ncbi:uncharacterized protein A4U43_C06F5570 [Asparagus officinalis]|uniref:methylated diphthine methylhydrolase n=1 Tax=Asparagus officinalis TaxID=4686 RepID=A0A5P1EQC2_ASPOF|nr:diphthine methyltransferase [Asparagus officinalis]ONK66230.1 uncharacterized protein A4U43_C06F5570 [Asparagus officinalis]
MDVASCKLDGNADVVEFCPQQNFHHILAAATYTLEEGTRPNRSGSISLFSADSNMGLELLHRIQTIGVFDIKWNAPGSTEHPLLAQADADGCLTLYCLQLNDNSTSGIDLSEVCTEKVSPAMCLCVDWNPSSSSVSLGLSDGSICIASVRESQLQISQSWVAHGYEVWATAFDISTPQLLYTGSDDCRFNCWDLREDPSSLVFQNAKSHKMGVCCFAQSPMNSNILLTGSYDEFLRVWDLRSMSKPVSKYSLCLGGGVWRLKNHPSIEGLVLAACMHNGFAIVRVGDESADIMESYTKHESLAYGADWQRTECVQASTERGSFVATCSFYDQLLRIWKPESLIVKPGY